MSVNLIYKHQKKAYALMKEALRKMEEQHMFFQWDVVKVFFL